MYFPRNFRKQAGVQAKFVEEDESFEMFPPFHRGIPVVDVEKSIGKHRSNISSMRSALGMSEEAFSLIVLPAIRKFAEFVGTLPASESHHHRYVGGLIDHSIEVATYAARMASSQQWPTSGAPEDRNREVQAYRVAITLGALTHDAAKPLTDYVVTAVDGREPGCRWDPLKGGLMAWASECTASRYFLAWRGRRGGHHEKLGAVFFKDIFAPSLLAYLRRYSDVPFRTLFHALSGSHDHLDDRTRAVLRDADAESVRRERLAHAEVEMRGTAVPVLGYVREAVRDLVRRSWSQNRPGARVWVMREPSEPERVFLAWRDGAQDILGWLRAGNVPAAPRSPEELLQLLADHGELVTHDEPGGDRRRWWLAPNLLNDGRKRLLWLSAIELREPGLWLGQQMAVMPVEGRIRPDGVEATEPVSAKGEPGVDPDDDGRDAKTIVSEERAPDQEGSETWHQLLAHVQTTPTDGLCRVQDGMTLVAYPDALRGVSQTNAEAGPRFLRLAESLVQSGHVIPAAPGVIPIVLNDKRWLQLTPHAAEELNKGTVKQPQNAVPVATIPVGSQPSTVPHRDHSEHQPKPPKREVSQGPRARTNDGEPERYSLAHLDAAASVLQAEGLVYLEPPDAGDESAWGAAVRRWIAALPMVARIDRKNYSVVVA